YPPCGEATCFPSSGERAIASPDVDEPLHAAVAATRGGVVRHRHDAAPRVERNPELSVALDDVALHRGGDGGVGVAADEPARVAESLLEAHLRPERVREPDDIATVVAVRASAGRDVEAVRVSEPGDVLLPDGETLRRDAVAAAHRRRERSERGRALR